MNTIKILTSNEIIAIEYFSIEESEKILTRIKELSEKFKTLDEGDVKAKFDIIAELKYLNGKYEGVRLVMEELERIAEKSYYIMR